MPPSGDKNSYRYLPLVGTVIMSEDPSPPSTLPETKTAVGIVIVCAVLVTLMSKIIRPKLVELGKFVNDKVIAPSVVKV